MNRSTEGNITKAHQLTYKFQNTIQQKYRQVEIQQGNLFYKRNSTIVNRKAYISLSKVSGNRNFTRVAAAITARATQLLNNYNMQ